MAKTSKHYFHICFMRDATVKFTRGCKEPQTTKLSYILHISVGSWEKDFTIWSVIK